VSLAFLIVHACCFDCVMDGNTGQTYYVVVHFVSFCTVLSLGQAMASVALRGGCNLYPVKNRGKFC